MADVGKLNWRTGGGKEDIEFTQVLEISLHAYSDEQLTPREQRYLQVGGRPCLYQSLSGDGRVDDDVGEDVGED